MCDNNINVHDYTCIKSMYNYTFAHTCTCKWDVQCICISSSCLLTNSLENGLHTDRLNFRSTYMYIIGRVGASPPSHTYGKNSQYYACRSCAKRNVFKCFYVFVHVLRNIEWTAICIASFSQCSLGLTPC